MYIQFE